jgi:hypothetical protein
LLQLILGGRVAVTGVGGDGSAYNARGSRVDRLAMPGAADAGGCRTEREKVLLTKVNGGDCHVAPMNPHP